MSQGCDDLDLVDIESEGRELENTRVSIDVAGRRMIPRASKKRSMFLYNALWGSSGAGCEENKARIGG